MGWRKEKERRDGEFHLLIIYSILGRVQGNSVSFRRRLRCGRNAAVIGGVSDGECGWLGGGN